MQHRNRLYRYNLPKEDFLNKKYDVKLAYGELTEKGVDQMLRIVGRELGRTDVFLDVGSGAGKVVIDVYLSTDVKKAIGVEIMKHRYDMSVYIKDALSRLYTDEENIIFHYGNILEMDFVEDATVVFFNCITWDHELCDKIVAMMKPGTIVIHNKKNLALSIKSTVEHTIETTWNKEAKFYKSIV